MRELTEQEEQEMIERAKAGDPKANYDMSLWALEQAVAEPEEERWNRLAAKCLVKAADAGYAPAQERMAQLLGGTDSAGDGPADSGDSFDWSKEPDRPASTRARRETEQPDMKLRAAAVGGLAVTAAGSAAKNLFRKGKSLLQKDTGDSGAAAEAPKAKHRSSGKVPFFSFSQWDDARWKKMQIVCVIVCVILAVLIAVMIISSKRAASEADASLVPTPSAAETVVPTPTIEPVVYPDESVRAEIEAASLDVYPEDTEYVDEETTSTVSAGAGLNLRKGPGSSYSQIVLMSYNSTVEVYAYKNGWALVKYNDSTWGWCSTDYLKS